MSLDHSFETVFDQCIDQLTTQENAMIGQQLNKIMKISTEHDKFE